MNILNRFKKNRKSSADTAKERLQIIISQERVKHQSANFLSQLQQDLLEVIAKYFQVDAEKIRDQLKVDMEKDGDNSVLELNITLPDLDLDDAIIETQ